VSALSATGIGRGFPRRLHATPGGAFVAFGVHPELAVAAVLAYRLFAFWLPTIPGAIAYLQLRRSLPSAAVTPPEPQAALA
jgi:hypothetical protein